MKYKSGSEFGYKLVKPFVIGIFKLKYKPIINGKENIPSSGALIFCGNHKHVDDQYNVIGVTKRVIHYMSKEEYFDGKLGWIYRFVGCIKVDRVNHNDTAKSEAVEILKNGGCVGIFPEGTRNKTIGTKDEVDLLPFKYGAVSLAQKTNALIVPFFVNGNYKKGEKLITNIGKPFSVNDMNLEEANKLLRKNILKLMDKNKK